MDDLESTVSVLTLDEDREKNLLEHITEMQNSIESRLDLIEEQVTGQS